MSLWDNFKDFTSGFVKTLPGGPVISAAGGLVGDVASAAGRQLLKPFEKLAELEGETLKGNALRQNISEFILPDTIGGYTATKAERQKASEKISMMRSLVIRTDTVLDKVLGRNILSSLQPESYDPKTGKLYNVYDEAKREERFDQLGFVGNALTGTGDLILGTFASPFIGLGALGKIGKVATLDKTITTKRVVAKKDLDVLTKAEQDRLDYLSAKSRLDEVKNEDILSTGRTADEVMAEQKALESSLPKLEAQAKNAAESLSKIGYASGFDEFLRQSTVLNAEQLLKHRVVKESSDPELLAGLLGENTDLYKAGLIVRSAAGDIRAQRLLAAESTSTFMALQRAKEPLGAITMKMKALKQTDGDLHELALLKENKDLLIDEFNDLLKQDAFLQRAVRAADQKVLEGRTGTSIFSSVESFRAAKARTFGEIGSSSNRLWDVQYFRRNPFVATVAVVTWPFAERPSGWVRTKGINTSDSAKEVEAFMRNVSAWEGTEGIAKRQQYMRQYLQATDEIARETIVKRIELDAIKSTGKKYNLTDEQVEAITNRIDKERGNTIKFFKERGFLIDENNERIYVPQLATQLADSIPMMDIIKFDNAIKNTASVWRQAKDATLDPVIRVADVIDEIWRPAVLMRLGYTQRNVLEGWGRSIAALGGITAIHSGGDILKISKEGGKYNIDGALANWSRNRHAGLLDKIAMRRAIKEAEDAKLATKGVAGATKRLPPIRASWDRVISLQTDAIAINKAKMASLQDELKDLGKDPSVQVQRNSIISELARRRQFDLDAVAQLRKYAKESNKKGVKGNRYRRGQGFISYGGYDDLPLTFEGDFGNVLMDLAGSEARIALELKSSNRVYAGLDNARYRDAGFTELHPDDPNYFVGLARAVNRQFRNSGTANRFMRGESLEDVVKYLKTQAGRQEMRAVRYTDPEEYALKIQYAVERYIPDAELRARIAKEEVSAAELKVVLGGRDDLRSIHGDNIEEMPDLRAYEKYTKTVRGIFRYLGAIPEDVFVRHPFADKIYQRALRESIDNANKQGVKLTADELNGIVAGARRKALQETRRTLYTIERYSNIANTVRFLEPFFAAAENTARVWGKLVYNDPRLLGAAGYIYNAPERAGMMQTDPLTGREVVVMQIPDWMRKGPFKKALENQEAISFEKGGANLILQGQDWWRIGDGVFTQVAASQILKSYPTTPIRPVLDYVLPFGPSRQPGSYDMLLPTVAKRVLDIYQGTDSRDYNSNFIIATQIENLKYRKGERDEPTPAEIKDRVDALSFLRAASSFTLPVSVRFRPEFQFYVDKARVYREKYGVDAAVRFYQDFPDYFEMFFSISRNPTGMDPTKDAIRYKNRYSNLLDAITDPSKGYAPEFLQLITNSYGAPTEFDNTAYTWQFLNEYRTGSGELIRQKQGVDDVATINNLQRGWIEWTKFKTKLDNVLKQRGLTSYNSAGAEDLSELRKLYVAQKQTENPVWWKEYNEGANSKRPYFFLKAVKTAMNDKKFMADRGQEPVWDAFSEYIRRRDQISKVLKSRAAQGGSSNMDAKANKDIADLWAITVEQIKDIDQTGAFTSFYNRFLDNDTLEEIK